MDRYQGYPVSTEQKVKFMPKTCPSQTHFKTWTKRLNYYMQCFARFGTICAI